MLILEESLTGFPLPQEGGEGGSGDEPLLPFLRWGIAGIGMGRETLYISFIIFTALLRIGTC